MKCLSKYALAAAAALALSGVANAATSTINPGAPGELNLHEALALSIARAQSNTNLSFGMISGSFGTLGDLATTLTGTVTDGVITTNYKLVRVSDNPAGPALLVNGGNYTTATDQVWQDGVVSFQATARYAGAANTAFGLRVGDMGTETVNNLLNASSNSLGTGVSFGPIGGSGKFTLQAQSTGGDSFSSLESVNSASSSGVTDYFVTFALLLETAPSVYTFDSFLVAFEDRRNGDFDYNDLIVQLRGPGAAEIPLPSAVLGGAALLGGVFLRRHM